MIKDGCLEHRRAVFLAKECAEHRRARRERVARIAMLAMFDNVEACELFRLIRAERRDGIDNLVKDERAANCERIGNDRRNDLRHQKMRLAVEQAVRTIRIDRRRRKEARRDGAPRVSVSL